MATRRIPRQFVAEFGDSRRLFGDSRQIRRP